MGFISQKNAAEIEQKYLKCSKYVMFQHKLFTKKVKNFEINKMEIFFKLCPEKHLGLLKRMRCDSSGTFPALVKISKKINLSFSSKFVFVFHKHLRRDLSKLRVNSSATAI